MELTAGKSTDQTIQLSWSMVVSLLFMLRTLFTPLLLPAFNNRVEHCHTFSHHISVIIND